MPAATAIQKVKATSSRFMGNNFRWQEGYGVFAVSASQLDVVKNYIANQIEHHNKYSFEDEFRALLTKYGITLPADAVP